jgi:hypothetical protein
MRIKASLALRIQNILSAQATEVFIEREEVLDALKLLEQAMELALSTSTRRADD